MGGIFMNKWKIALTVLSLGVLLIVAGCAQQNQMSGEQAVVSQAVTVMHPTQGNSVQGVVTFTKVDNGIRIVADISGLTPGKHGFHIHQYGDCRAADGTSAGGHFNPHNVPHAGPNDTPRHVGDLGNLEADQNGNAHYDRVDQVVAFSGENDIIGRGVIIHAGEDDLTSQPTGAAGPRVACGVIGVANPDYGM